MIERVVVPMDDSPESQRALMVASTLAGWAAAPIELLAVVVPHRVADTEARLRATAAELAGDASVRVIPCGGPLVPALTTHLDADRDALWCVGSHARTATAELRWGSVSEDLVRQAHVPIALVGPAVETPPTGRVLVVALDGADLAAMAVGPAAELADALGMSLRLLQVVDPEGIGAHADVLETAYLSRLPIGPGRGSSRDYDVLHSRHPADALSDQARVDPTIGMIALATHGRSATQRVLHPSVAFDLAHQAPVPVVVLHPAGAT